MAFSLNRIMLIGNLGKDVENRFTGDTLSISSFSLATTHSFKGKDGNWVNETTWHNITAYNLSDFMKEQLKKGKKVYVEGRLKKREYTDKEGVKRYTTEIVSERIIPLEGSGESSGYSESNSESSAQDGDIPPVDSNDDLPF
ncbi:MAG: single-stranded DNA-binding protein [Ignavibacteriales bacterium UTCHB2]|jgi:single-strand DNA-binding protein|nr:MAG: Single-stranded DNA-binding protein [Ignavibacteria bacterium ADurb.Bin266]OQY71040.1 MAG: single-stranded DNA-binding protein [Ignavibacteriales bacterium UTCHB2]HQI41999.1 single-stranded DNA-binding protein [Ignavibacteriaceae bacterium]HQJ45887.1 single-stranded DNA-binding protein [Ignavibacteriaceae bacterium]